MGNLYVFTFVLENLTGILATLLLSALYVDKAIHSFSSRENWDNSINGDVIALHFFPWELSCNLCYELKQDNTKKECTPSVLCKKPVQRKFLNNNKKNY